jgi:hypothetical protein
MPAYVNTGLRRLRSIRSLGPDRIAHPVIPAKVEAPAIATPRSVLLKPGRPPGRRGGGAGACRGFRTHTFAGNLADNSGVSARHSRSANLSASGRLTQHK